MAARKATGPLARIDKAIRAQRCAFEMFALCAGTRGESYLRIPIKGVIGKDHAEAGERHVVADDVIKKLRANLGARKIVVDIHSRGGSGKEARRIYAALRAHGGRIITVAERGVFSAAMVIFLAGDTRKASSHSTKFMMHRSQVLPDYSGSRGWTAADHLRASRCLDRYDQEYLALVAERTGKRAKDFHNHYMHDVIFDEAVALRLNIVTEPSASVPGWTDGRDYAPGT